MEEDIEVISVGISEDSDNAPGLSKRNVLITLILSLLSIGAIVYATSDRETYEALSRLSFWSIAALILLAYSKWLWGAFRLWILIPDKAQRPPFVKLLIVSMSGALFGCITPMRMGGAPSEAYFITKLGLPPAMATAVIGAGMLFSTFLFLASFPFAVLLARTALNISVSTSWILAFALLLAIIYTVVLIRLMRNSEIPRRFFSKYEKVFDRRGMKRAARTTRSLEHAMIDFSDNLSLIAKMGPFRYVLAGIATLAFWGTAILVIPLSIYFLGFEDLFWKALIAQTIVQLLLPFIPVPGSGGVGDFGFGFIYSMVLPTYMIGLVALLWRFFDTYMAMILGSISIFFLRKDIARKGPRYYTGQDHEDCRIKDEFDDQICNLACDQESV